MSSASMTRRARCSCPATRAAFSISDALAALAAGVIPRELRLPEVVNHAGQPGSRQIPMIAAAHARQVRRALKAWRRAAQRQAEGVSCEAGGIDVDPHRVNGR